VFLWIERYGRELKEVAIAQSSLTKTTLRAALKNLPNVEPLKLH
jgi:TolB-like protein